MGDGRERKGRDLDEVVVWCVGPYPQQEQNRLEVVTPRVVGPPLTGLITGQGEDPPTLTPRAISGEPEAQFPRPLPPEPRIKTPACWARGCCPLRDGEAGGPDPDPEPPQTRQRNRSQPSWLPAQSRLPGGLADSWAGLLPGPAGRRWELRGQSHSPDPGYPL